MPDTDSQRSVVAYTLRSIIRPLPKYTHPGSSYTLTPTLGPEYSHLTLVSDGVSSVVSDEEISDLARGAKDPRDAAQRIISFASEMASQDNLTAIVVPLAGWGKVTGPDRTKAFREDRLTAMIGMERLQRM